MTEIDDKKRWLVFALLCLGDLMIVLDSTIVNVALPSLRGGLGFTDASLVWVVTAYLLTFGGFMLLGGRMADLYGQRRMFVGGVVLFTVASLVCGLSLNAPMLIMARAIQGLGGAVVSAVTLSLLMMLFPEGPQRVKAMGYFGFVMAGGGSVGVLLGGLITGVLDWRWIFLINIPIGVAVAVLCFKLLPARTERAVKEPLDIAGAISVTLALMLAVYGLEGGQSAGYGSPQTLGMLGAAVVLAAVFLVIEARTRAPLMPLRIFRNRNLSVANIVGVLWAAAMFAWFFLSTLYMQGVLGYGPLQVGLALLPSNLIMGAFSFKLSALMVNRLGIRVSLALGLACAAAGLALFGLAPADGTFVRHVLPPMLLLGLGAGMAFNPVLLAATSDIEEHESGIASGVVNTSFMMGGALGLAALASLAGVRTAAASAAGAPMTQALTVGYQAAFWGGAICAAVAAVLGCVLLKPSATPQGGHGTAH